MVQELEKLETPGLGVLQHLPNIRVLHSGLNMMQSSHA